MRLSMVPVLIRLVHISRQFLNLQIVETLVHQKVDSNYFVELVHSETTNCFEDAEEDCAEDG